MLVYFPCGFQYGDTDSTIIRGEQRKYQLITYSAQNRKGGRKMWNRKRYSQNMDAKKYIESNLDDIWKELKKIKITVIMAVTTVILKRLTKKFVDRI